MLIIDNLQTVGSMSKIQVKHKDDTGAFVIVSDPLRNVERQELYEDIQKLKEGLKGKMSSELLEE